MSKVLGKCLKISLIQYFDNHNFFYVNQFGFRIISQQIIHYMELLNYILDILDVKQHVLGMFLDIKKALDTVDYKILLD
jgi:hypothetical protein